MSGTYAPAALEALFVRAHDLLPDLDLVNAGIVGDAKHGSGYHLGRYALPSSDYSVYWRDDRRGDGWAAAALDIRPGTLAGQELLTRRLMAAAKANDPRLAAMREFFGTLDGKRVTGWDRHDPRNAHDDGYTTSDTSHLWHIHISVYRVFATNTAALLPIADVLAGLTESDSDMTPEEWQRLEGDLDKRFAELRSYVRAMFLVDTDSDPKTEKVQVSADTVVGRRTNPIRDKLDQVAGDVAAIKSAVVPVKPAQAKPKAAGK